MDEASPFRVLMPAVSLTARTYREIGPPHPSDPIMGGPECRSRREARTLRATSKPGSTEQSESLTPTRPDREDSNSEMSAQIIPLKGRTDFWESSRILAT